MAMIAVISDIHANSFALDAVLSDIKARGATEIYCLGDLVGYNAHPRETLRMLRQADIPAVKGNHDMMAIGELPLGGCGPNANFSQQWTRQQLSDDERDYLQALPMQRLVQQDIVLLHSRLDDPLNYLSRDADYLAEYERLRAWQPAARICFTGHTHVARIIEITPERQLQRLQTTVTALSSENFYFINPGSVGHPRGSDYRASYALFDQASRQIRLLRVHYDKAAMLAVNQRVDIRTNLGPSLLEHRLARATQRLKKVLT